LTDDANKSLPPSIEWSAQASRSSSLLPSATLSNRLHRDAQSGQGDECFLFPQCRCVCCNIYTLSSFGDRSFATAGPRAWNKLPSHLRLMQSADTFRRHLKHIFISPGLFIMTLLGALVVLLHLRRRNLDLLDRSIDGSIDRWMDGWMDR